ncbi:MAG: hypothetical protein GF393_10785 [Armatimonadia bacterium]|nr:hypothetical protein [Armatimonadia bacterium]
MKPTREEREAWRQLVSEKIHGEPPPLRCFLIDDSERHWVSAHSAEHARQILIDEWGLLDSELDGAVIHELGPGTMIEVVQDEIILDEKYAKKMLPPRRTIVATATATEWCAHVGIGIIASTCF